MCEIIAIIIVVILIIMMCYKIINNLRKNGFQSLEKITQGPHIYYDYDLSYNNFGYPIVVTDDAPINFNIILFTEDNFGGWAVPIRKGRNVLLAEQYTPNIKYWNFKSMKMKPGSKIQLKVISAFPEKELLGLVEFINQGYSSVININTLILTHSDIRSSTFGKIFIQNDPNRKYYIQEV